MIRALLGALSRAAKNAVGWRHAKPIARLAAAVAGLSLLAFIGRTAVGGALAASAVASAPSAAPSPIETGERSSAVASGASPVRQPALSGVPPPGEPAATGPPPGAARTAASPDDPVILNTATEEDLRRLPGIGAKRASAILALRSHMARFRAIEDLLKVKGIGRATLKRLRPLVRLDPRPDAAPVRPDSPRDPADAGASMTPAGSPR